MRNPKGNREHSKAFSTHGYSKVSFKNLNISWTASFHTDENEGTSET